MRYIDANELRNKLRGQAAKEWNMKAAPNSWSQAFEYVIGEIDAMAANSSEKNPEKSWIDGDKLLEWYDYKRDRLLEEYRHEKSRKQREIINLLIATHDSFYFVISKLRIDGEEE